MQRTESKRAQRTRERTVYFTETSLLRSEKCIQVPWLHKQENYYWLLRSNRKENTTCFVAGYVTEWWSIYLLCP